ncbi:hypothetical protein BDZ89DRAFT_948864 [Hymenopellis radicata]|nr:hypothetical protein BDZ89DRAFT_948864 [Hymenopellis radicata]
MIVFALEYRDSISDFTGKIDNDLRDLELSSDEWKILEEIAEILKDATVFFSTDSPTLSEVIPAMDNIDAAFTNFIIEETIPDPANPTTHAKVQEIHLSDIIKSSVSVAKLTLNKYYTLTDDSEVYRFAMILHPEHKLDYFKNTGWSDDWIDNAREMMRVAYRERYEPRYELLTRSRSGKATKASRQSPRKAMKKVRNIYHL